MGVYLKGSHDAQSVLRQLPGVSGEHLVAQRKLCAFTEAVHIEIE